MCEAWGLEYERFLNQKAKKKKNKNREKDKSSSASPVDTRSDEEEEAAPVLINDEEDEAINVNTGKRYRDEPPILEPVPNEISDSNSEHSHTSAHKQQSKVKLKMFQTKIELSSTKNNSNQTQSKESKLKLNRSKESGNIFDKFNSLSDDSPQLLVPSPESLEFGDSPDGNVELINSPDFVAMEADSTSEISFLRNSDIKSSKNRIEMSGECDSTCMFSASPSTIIVSPSPNPNNDNPDDSSIITHKKVESEKQSFSDATSKKHKDISKNKHLHKLSDGYFCERHSNLSSVLKRKSRTERHTIDNCDALSVKKLKPFSSDTGVDIDILHEKLKTNESTDVNEESNCSTDHSQTNNLIHRSHIDSKKRHHSCKSQKKKRQRSNTVAVSTPSQYANYIPSHLEQFVSLATQLSRLQCRVHFMLGVLFPGLKEELSSISPESQKFEDFISDLVVSLEQPNINQNQKPNQRLETMGSNCRNRSSTNKILDGSSSTENTSNFPSDSDQSSLSSLDPAPLRETVMPGLSRLSLEPVSETNLKPVKVFLRSDSGQVLETFSSLLCQVLQLLFPDVPVSLPQEFELVPHDLLTLVDNIVAVNVKKS